MAFNKHLLNNKESQVFTNPRTPNTVQELHEKNQEAERALADKEVKKKAVIKEAEKVVKKATKKQPKTLLGKLKNGSFDEDDIKHRNGFGGKKLKYVDRYAVIKALNETFDNKWDFEIISIQDIIVSGAKVGATAVCKLTITHPKLKRSIMEIGESEGKSATKAAVSDSLKRCSSMALNFYNEFWKE